MKRLGLKLCMLYPMLINIDGQKLSGLRFADGVAHEHHLNAVNDESLEICLKIHKEKTNSMKNIDTIDNMQINGTEIEKVTNNKYLGQAIAMENRTKQEVSIRIKAGWSVLESKEKFSGQAPSHESK